jgi:hypothetical protein
MSQNDPATAENPPSDTGAGDTKRDKGPSSTDAVTAAGVGGADTAADSLSESSADTGDNKRKPGPGPESAAEAGVGGSD